MSETLDFHKGAQDLAMARKGAKRSPIEETLIRNERRRTKARAKKFLLEAKTISSHRQASSVS